MAFWTDMENALDKAWRRRGQERQLGCAVLHNQSAGQGCQNTDFTRSSQSQKQFCSQVFWGHSGISPGWMLKDRAAESCAEMHVYRRTCTIKVWDMAALYPHQHLLFNFNHHKWMWWDVSCLSILFLIPLSCLFWPPFMSLLVHSLNGCNSWS